MATTKTKEELVRMGWLTALRHQGERQCHGFQKMGDKACALQMLSEITDIPLKVIGDYAILGAAAGLTAEQTDDVWVMNDGDYYSYPPIKRHTFSEIADVVESWFSK